MKAKEFVLSKYPDAFHYRMIDTPRLQMSSVILKGNGMEIFDNYGAETASKAWTNARKQIEKETLTPTI